MQFLSARRIVGALAAIMLTSSTAFGGAWTIPSGNTDTLGGPLSFSYSNGGDVNGLFNDPFIFGDAFFFTTAFTASAANGTRHRKMTPFPSTSWPTPASSSARFP